MTNSDGPLAGVKVVEITSVYSGPYAGMLLAEMGADVTKVEGPDGPDPMRASGLGSGPDSVNSIFYSLNRGKRFASIDATTDRGRELLFELASSADVFLTNMRAGKDIQLGVGYEALKAANPSIIHAAINGLGADGPEADQPIFDYVIQAKTGMVDYQRDENGKGDLMHQLVVDKTSANAVVQGVLAALFSRERTGEGQQVSVPMISAGIHFAWTDAYAAGLAELEPMIPWEHLPPHLRSAPASFLPVLKTKDGEIATGILLPPWDGLCLALDKAEWTVDERFSEQTPRILNFPALLEAVQTEVEKYTTAEVLARFAEHDFAAGEVKLRTDLFDDPTVKHLGLISEQDAESLGRVRQPAPMWQFTGTPAQVTTSIGETGRDTREVLARLGVSAKEVEQLVGDGIAKEPS
ncbi:MAG: crotonobetainyl-CoA:carnitine CoA-transferase CaiB-like acyl-CoA transferase [Candidatus Poriferisodalaceae bacterium]|jgi:crotonobetainyl-CoA:carnitine CoA-transferase CaiB-like acyl-CoA transferase